MREFGTRFEDIKSGYLLIARALDDGTIKWDCVADQVSVDALEKRYLPETCKDEEEEEKTKRKSVVMVKNWRHRIGLLHIDLKWPWP